MYNGPALTIRRAAESDLPRIVTLCQSFLADTDGSFLDEEVLRPWSEGKEAEKYIRSVMPNVYLAELGGHLAGVVSMEERLIGLLWVEQDLRGKRIGSELLAYAEAALKIQGCNPARVKCFEPNHRAIKFYQARGWQIVDSELDEPSGAKQIILEKELNNL